MRINIGKDEDNTEARCARCTSPEGAAQIAGRLFGVHKPAKNRPSQLEKRDSCCKNEVPADSAMPSYTYSGLSRHPIVVTSSEKQCAQFQLSDFPDDHGGSLDLIITSE